MIRRLVVLAAALIVAFTVAFIDAFPGWVLIALAVIAWGVWFALVRAEVRR